MKKQKEEKTDTLAIVGFVFSLIFFIPLLSFIGVVLGIVALVKINKNNKSNSNVLYKGKGLAIAAIIIGIIITAIQILFIVFIVKLFTMISTIDPNSGGSIQEKTDKCLSKYGYEKDLCIVLLVGSNINQTEIIDQNICEDVGDEDTRNLCNAILKNDGTYCQKISDSDSRIQCYGIIGEIENKN